jgi:type IV secretory pathway VirB10-like protein
MGFLTGNSPPPPPKAPEPLPPPVIEDTQAKGAQDADALRRRQGRASTVLTGKTTQDAGPAQTASKALLGS